MSSAFSAPTGTSEACPLCGAPLRADQDWCLSCGAAARTRLAAPANWRAPILALGVTVVLSLAVLSVALVKLAENPSPAKTATTTPPATSAAAPVPAVTALSTVTSPSSASDTLSTPATATTQSTITATTASGASKLTLAPQTTPGTSKR
jgi:hypothetical protein